MDRRTARGCGRAGHSAGVITPAVGTRSNTHVLPVDRCVDPHRACHHVEHLLRGGIQAGAGDQDVTLAHAEAAQASVRGQEGVAGAQCHAVGIDKTATRAGDSVRVGKHHVCSAAQHFGKTRQLAAVV